MGEVASEPLGGANGSSSSQGTNGDDGAIGFRGSSGNGHANGHPGNGHGATNGTASNGRVPHVLFEVVVAPFESYGRLAHVRRALMAIDGVKSVKIVRFADREAHFLVDLAPGLAPDCIAIPGTSQRTVTATRVELLVVRRNGSTA